MVKAYKQNKQNKTCSRCRVSLHNLSQLLKFYFKRYEKHGGLQLKFYCGRSEKKQQCSRHFIGKLLKF